MVSLASCVWHCLQYHALALFMRWRTPSTDHCFPHCLPSPHPFATQNPTAQARLTPPGSAANSARGLSGSQCSPTVCWSPLVKAQPSVLLGWKLNSLICSLGWDEVAPCVHVNGLFQMQRELALPAFAFPGEPAPWLLWDPLHGLEPDSLQPHQCPEKRVQESRCTSGYQPKSRGKISSEKYFGFHSGNFTEGVSALYSEASLGDKWSLICLRVGASNCLSFMAFGLCWTLMEHSKD